jgi:hypothetical protein
MLPDMPALVKCRECKYLFWIDDAEKLDEIELRSEKSKWQSATNYDHPSWSEYLAFATTNNLSREQERYIRMRTWWKMNDSIRNTQEAERDLRSSEEFKSNLVALLGVLEEADPEERLLKAEAARELGQFEKCQILLQFEFPDAMRHAVLVISELNRQHNTRVAELITKE